MASRAAPNTTTPSRRISVQRDVPPRRNRAASCSLTSRSSTRFPARRPAFWLHSSRSRCQPSSSSWTAHGRTTTMSMSLLRSASPRASEPNTTTLTGAGSRRPAEAPSSSRTVWRVRVRAATAREATFSGTNRNNAEGGTSRRSTTPSSTSTGITRDDWATLTPDSRAMVRRFSSAVVSASTAKMRPWAPGMRTWTGRMKSTEPSFQCIAHGPDHHRPAVHEHRVVVHQRPTGDHRPAKAEAERPLRDRRRRFARQQLGRAEGEVSDDHEHRRCGQGPPPAEPGDQRHRPRRQEQHHREGVETNQCRARVPGQQPGSATATRGATTTQPTASPKVARTRRRWIRR